MLVLREDFEVVVKEHYLRDDIHSGTPLDPNCPPESQKLSAKAPHYIAVFSFKSLEKLRLNIGRVHDDS